MGGIDGLVDFHGFSSTVNLEEKEEGKRGGERSKKRENN